MELSFICITAQTVIRFFSTSAKFGICPVVGLNGTLVEAIIRTVKCLKCTFKATMPRDFRLQIFYGAVSPKLLSILGQF